MKDGILRQMLHELHPVGVVILFQCLHQTDVALGGCPGIFEMLFQDGQQIFGKYFGDKKRGHEVLIVVFPLDPVRAGTGAAFPEDMGDGAVIEDEPSLAGDAMVCHLMHQGDEKFKMIQIPVDGDPRRQVPHRPAVITVLACPAGGDPELHLVFLKPTGNIPRRFFGNTGQKGLRVYMLM